MNNNNYKSISEEEFEKWCDSALYDYSLIRLKDILTGEYPLDEAREDILSFRKTDENR